MLALDRPVVEPDANHQSVVRPKCANYDQPRKTGSNRGEWD